MQGRDHIWLAPHDEGACWFPTDIYQHSIILTHWGRMDPEHTSNTAFAPDNYSQPWVDPGEGYDKEKRGGEGGLPAAYAASVLWLPLFLLDTFTTEWYSPDWLNLFIAGR